MPDQPPTEATSASGLRWLASPWLWAFLVMAVVLAGGDPLALQADPLGEGSNHLWMFWRALERMGGRTGALANVPVGLQLPLMDPVNLPAFSALGWVHPALGWRAMEAWNVGLAMAGCYALARPFTSQSGAVVAMVAGGSAPFLAGVMDFGITESWPLGWFGLHAACLVRYSREGDVRHAIVAGLCLGMVALSGWYHAVYGLVFELVWVPALLWRSRRLGLLWQGGLALVMTLPSLWAFLPVRGQWAPRLRWPAPGPPGPRPDWAELPVFGADLLTFVVPHPAAVHPSKSTYLGLVVLVLAVVGVVRRRSARWLVLGAVPFLVLALGYWPTVGGVAMGVPGPARALVHAVPALLGMSHWQRAVGPAVVLLAAAAGVGAGPWVRRHPAVLALVCSALMMDGIWGGGTAWPRTVAPLELPASLAAVAEPGGLLQIPFDNGRRPFTDEPPRLYQQWQVIHGRAISENYEGVDVLLDTVPTVAFIDEACSVATTLPPYYQPRPEMRGQGEPTDLPGDLAGLRAAGLRWLVLHRDRCRTPAKAIRRIEGMLGPRRDLPGGDALWDLQ